MSGEGKFDGVEEHQGEERYPNDAACPSLIPYAAHLVCLLSNAQSQGTSFSCHQLLNFNNCSNWKSGAWVVQTANFKEVQMSEEMERRTE